MTVAYAGFSIESLMLPHEHSDEYRRFHDQWMAAYPCAGPIERGFVEQAFVAQLEQRRVHRARTAVRIERVRTAVLRFDHEQEDDMYRSLMMFNEDCDEALRRLTRTAPGCRWAIAEWERLQKRLAEDGTWYGGDRIAAIQLQGVSACLDQLIYYPESHQTWLDCIVTQPNAKQWQIDRILDPKVTPMAVQERDAPLWPGNPAESRARLQALVDAALPKLRALEETLRVEYEEPARADAKDRALAEVTKEEMMLLQAERMHEKSYLSAVDSLMKFRASMAAAPGLGVVPAIGRDRGEGVLPPEPWAGRLSIPPLTKGEFGIGEIKIT